MEYLGLNDVLKAALVNKQWSEIARIVRKQRKNLPFTVLAQPYSPHHKLAFEYFNAFEEVSEEAKDLVESGKEGYYPYKKFSRRTEQFEGLVNQAKEGIRKAVIGGYDEPQMIVNFGTSYFTVRLAKDPKSPGERMKPFMGGIQDSVPVLSSFSCGVIASVPECDNKALEMESVKFPVLSTLAIPKVAGLRTQIFTIKKDQLKQLKGKKITATTSRTLLGINDANESDLKGVMIFHKPNHQSAVTEALYQYFSANPHVALAGGVHDSVFASGVDDYDIVAGGILFFGNDSVRVSAVALHEPEMPEENLEKMEKLKSTVLPGEHSFAFMFACNGRGYQMHMRPNVESDLFNSLFPNVPMVGAFTFGEYCNDNLSNFDESGGDEGNDKEEKKRIPPRRIDFSYTTVFLLVSYKFPKADAQKESTT